MKKAALLAVAGLAMSSSAWAQTGAPAGATPASAVPSSPSASSSFSDDELQKFASAAIQLNKIQADAGVAATDKQPKMLAAVQASGLDPAKFNAIAQAAQTDSTLQQKIQAAAAKSTPAP
jgi:hypothetical protein